MFNLIVRIHNCMLNGVHKIRLLLPVDVDTTVFKIWLPSEHLHSSLVWSFLSYSVIIKTTSYLSGYACMLPFMWKDLHLPRSITEHLACRIPFESIKDTDLTCCWNLHISDKSFPLNSHVRHDKWLLTKPI